MVFAEVIPHFLREVLDWLVESGHLEKPVWSNPSPALGLVMASRKSAARLTHNLVLWYCHPLLQERFMEDREVLAQVVFRETRRTLTEKFAWHLCYM